MTLPRIRKFILVLLLIFIVFLPVVIYFVVQPQQRVTIAQMRCSNQDKESVCGSLGYRLKLHAPPQWEGAWYVTGLVGSWSGTHAEILLGEKKTVDLIFSQDVSAVCLPPSPYIPENKPYGLADMFATPLLLLSSDSRLPLAKIKTLYPATSIMVAVTKRDIRDSYSVDHVGFFGCEITNLVAPTESMR